MVRHTFYKSLFDSKPGEFVLTSQDFLDLSERFASEESTLQQHEELIHRSEVHIDRLNAFAVLLHFFIEIKQQ